MSSTPLTRTELITAMTEIGRKNSTGTVLFHHALAERLGLNPTDHKCVDIIMQRGPITAGQLAEITGLTTGTITAVLDRLEKGHFVQRRPDAHDRRKVLLYPNTERFPEIGDLFANFLAAQNELFDRYSDEELTLILNYMTAATQLIEEQGQRLRDAKKPKR